MFVPFLSLVSQTGIQKEILLDSLKHDIDSLRQDIKELDAKKKNVNDQERYRDSVNTIQHD